MVVVEQGAASVDREVEFVVTNTRQTSAGKMIFGRMTDGQVASSALPPPAPKAAAGAAGSATPQAATPARGAKPSSA
jgi:hypothetical protein